MSKLTLSFLFCFIAGILSAGQAFAAPFTPGNIAVCRVGDGVAAITNTGTAVFVDEYTPSGTLVQTVAMPTAISGSNLRLVVVGTGTTDCQITRSSDGRYLVITGYDAATGTASLGTTASATVNRVLGRIDSAGVINTTTGLNDAFTGSAIRGAASSNGVDFWVIGGNQGVRYASIGSTTSTLVSPTITNLRTVNIFGGQLFTSTASGTNTRVGMVGTGLPTTATTTTNFAGLTTGSAYNFYFFDLSATEAGQDTLYVAHDDANALQKWSKVSGVWMQNGTIGVTADSYRGLTGKANGSTVTLYATRTANKITSIVDSSGYNAVPAATVVTDLVTATTNTAFRGIATAPCEVGTLRYSSTVYSVVRTGIATITVQRPNTCDGNVSIDYQTVSFGTPNPATPEVDYTPAMGTLNFGPNDMTKTFTVRTFLSGEGKDIGLNLNTQVPNFNSFNKGLQVLARINILAPTAADASVRGRLLTPARRGLSNATIILTDTNSGQVRYARSTSLGYFNFRDLESGDFYVLSVKSKSYTFVNQSFTLNENIDDLILTAQ
jgi:Carboxypeptidase regulatory-like domain/Calx-beta domain